MYYNKVHKQIVETRGYKYVCSYRKNEITIDSKNKKFIDVYIRIICSYCENEYDISLAHFKKGNKCTNCCNSYENSFAYYIQQELKEPLNKYWDWEKNIVNPYLIRKGSSKKIWIKCNKTNYHGSYITRGDRFYAGHRCPYCCHIKGRVHPKDSFAQWGIDNIDKDFLTKYWSSKNTLNPWELTPQSSKKVWILCQDKDYHNDNGGYLTRCDSFYRNRRCSYCKNNKVHPKDSFGYLYPQKAKYWSKSNDKSPFEIAPYSSRKYKFYCEDCGEEFETDLGSITSNTRSMKCRKCTSSKGEQKIKEWLMDNNINFEQQKTFKHLTGIGEGLLSYDFYLPQYKLLIEYQGIQHEKYIKYFYKSKKDFLNQLEHDKRKRIYAKNNKIKLLEIWYYDFENINNALKNTLNL